MLQLLRDRDELARHDLAVATADVEHALVRVDRVEHGRRRVAAGVEREAGPERDAHAEHLERVLLERDHVASCPSTESSWRRGASQAPRRSCGCVFAIHSRFFANVELHVTARGVGRLAEEAPEQLAVVVDDEPEAHGVAPRLRERRDRDAPGVAQDLAEGGVELAPVGEGEELVDALGEAALRAPARGARRACDRRAESVARRASCRGER